MPWRRPIYRRFRRTDFPRTRSPGKKRGRGERGLSFWTGLTGLPGWEKNSSESLSILLILSKLSFDAGRPYSHDAAIPAAACERAGGYAAAFSAGRLLRTVFRGREGSVGVAEPRAHPSQQRADVRHAV